MYRTLLALVIFGLAVGCATVAPPESGAEGVTELAACDGPPRCVVSRDDAGDRRIDPLRFDASPGVARLALMQWLTGQEGVEVAIASDHYIHAVFTTPRLRYRDDVEFLIRADQGGTRIDVRSASRIGWYDWNTNRNRVEGLRRALTAGGGR